MTKIFIKKLNTRAPKNLNKEKILKENAKMISKIQAYQYKMFAEGKRSMLIVLQGLDAAGKDWVVRSIFSGMNPLWTNATSFRVPTKEELSHDFLWRIHQKTPANGTVEIFNRSHYEDILVPTVEKLLDKKIIDKRYDQINNFENLLEENGTTVVKFYLNISKDKQKAKLYERLTDSTKYWKHNIGDWDTRDNYDEYMDVYEDIFATCNKPEWNIIAADQNWYKIYQICKILLKIFEDMKLQWPKLAPDQETAYLKMKAELAAQNDTKLAKKVQAKKDKKAAKKLAKQQKKEEKKLLKAKEKADKKIEKINQEEAKLEKQQNKLEEEKENIVVTTPNKRTTATKKPIAQKVIPETK